MYDTTDTVISGISTAMIVNMTLVLLAISVLMIIGTWMVYKKAGEPGWGSLIPFYSTYLLVKITYGNGWLFLLFLIPFVNFIFAIMIPFKLAKVFGKSGFFGLGLWFLPGIFYPILGFGKAEYQGIK